VGSVHVGASVEQLLDGCDASRVSGDHERGLAVPSRGLGVCAGFEKFGDERGVAGGAGQGKGRLSVFIGGVHFGAGGEEGFGGVAIVEVGGPGEGGGAVG